MLIAKWFIKQYSLGSWRWIEILLNQAIFMEVVCTNMRQCSPRSGLSSSTHWGVGGDIIIIIILGDIHQSGLYRYKAMLIAKWFIKQYSLEGWRYNNNINQIHFLLLLLLLGDIDQSGLCSVDAYQAVLTGKQRWI